MIVGMEMDPPPPATEVRGAVVPEDKNAARSEGTGQVDVAVAVDVGRDERQRLFADGQNDELRRSRERDPDLRMRLVDDRCDVREAITVEIRDDAAGGSRDRPGQQQQQAHACARRGFQAVHHHQWEPR